MHLQFGTSLLFQRLGQSLALAIREIFGCGKDGGGKDGETEASKKALSNFL